MKQLYRALSVLASNQTFCRQLWNIAASAPRPDLEITPEVRAQLPVPLQKLALSKQPDFAAVESIRSAFRQLGIELSVYEGCELNRWLYEDKERSGGNPNAAFENMRTYWRALGAVTTTGTQDVKDAAAALAIDEKFREDFIANSVNLTDIGYNVDDNTQNSLRALLATGGAADLAARRFVSDTWSSTCESVARSWDGWFYFNS